MLSLSEPTIRTAINHVIRLATKRDACAEGDRPAMAAFGAGHARGDRGQDQNALESFAEDEHADIEECDRRTRVGPHRIGRALRRNSLPNQHRDHKKSCCNDADAQSGLHLPSNLS